ncbi:hypothetical protein CR513_55670, partial [Mucuna pruriens]
MGYIYEAIDRAKEAIQKSFNDNEDKWKAFTNVLTGSVKVTIHTPHLQNIAIEVLSLTCSSLGCEHNWSTFEHIHSKKRSRLEHQKLQDLTYVKYIQALHEHECHNLNDHIALKDFLRKVKTI